MVKYYKGKEWAHLHLTEDFLAKVQPILPKDFLAFDGILHLGVWGIGILKEQW